MSPANPIASEKRRPGRPKKIQPEPPLVIVAPVETPELDTAEDVIAKAIARLADMLAIREGTAIDPAQLTQAINASRTVQ